MKAYEILKDCKCALQLLEDEIDPQAWRIHWVAAIALIRAVGHVLHKVDGASDASIMLAVNKRYSVWNGSKYEHAIFRDFIEKERNSILKEYASDVYPLAEIGIILEAKPKTGDSNDAIVEPEIFELDENIYRPMLDGKWEGEDARDVLNQAILWWEQELSIVRALSQKGSM